MFDIDKRRVLDVYSSIEALALTLMREVGPAPTDDQVDIVVCDIGLGGGRMPFGPYTPTRRRILFARGFMSGQNIHLDGGSYPALV
ncbi:MAG: hypothetical protein Q8M24_26040 [Pseudolabrys sp.]|nr:hypothetical protein [Pseudolabrys sp.]MDP2298916.1 hypothetical protein [Pseudolabrys sp.]